MILQIFTDSNEKFPRGGAGTNLTGGIGGGCPNVRRILLNQPPNILVIGGQDFGREVPEIRRPRRRFRNF